MFENFFKNVRKFITNSKKFKKIQKESDSTQIELWNNFSFKEKRSAQRSQTLLKSDCLFQQFMMLLPLTQCLRVDQLRASFQKHVSEIIRNINDDICSLVVGIIWRGILVRDKGKGPLFFSKNYFHVGTTGPLKAAQVALNLARVFSTIKNKQKVFAGLTSPIFF